MCSHCSSVAGVEASNCIYREPTSHLHSPLTRFFGRDGCQGSGTARPGGSFGRVRERSRLLSSYLSSGGGRKVSCLLVLTLLPCHSYQSGVHV